MFHVEHRRESPEWVARTGSVPSATAVAAAFDIPWLVFLPLEKEVRAGGRRYRCFGFI